MIRRLLELAAGVLGFVIGLRVALELARWLYALAGGCGDSSATHPPDPRSPERGSGAYPNTYGVRLEPLRPDELAAAVEGEAAIARRLLEHAEGTADAGAGDPLGSVSPAADEGPPRSRRQPSKPPAP